MGVEVFLTLLPALQTPFLLLGSLTQPWCEGLCRVLLYPVPSSVDIPKRPALFSGKTGVRREWILGEREVGVTGRSEGWGSLVRIYCVREEKR